MHGRKRMMMTSMNETADPLSLEKMIKHSLGILIFVSRLTQSVSTIEFKWNQVPIETSNQKIDTSYGLHLWYRLISGSILKFSIFDL